MNVILTITKDVMNFKNVERSLSLTKKVNQSIEPTVTALYQGLKMKRSANIKSTAIAKMALTATIMENV